MFVTATHCARRRDCCVVLSRRTELLCRKGKELCRVHEVVSVVGRSCFHENALHARIRDHVFREIVRDVKSRVPVARVIARCLDEVVACKFRCYTVVIRQLVNLRLELDRVHMILLEFVSLRKLRV